MLRLVCEGTFPPPMHYAVSLLALLHAIGHLPGFLVPWQFFTPPDFAYRTTIFGGRLNLGPQGILLYGSLYLAFAIAFAALAYGFWVRSAWCFRVLFAAIPLSIFCCLADWPQARLGIAANLLLLLLALLAFAFPGGRLPAADPQLEALWRQPLPALRLTMHGHIKLRNWAPFVAEQVLRADGQFIWSAATTLFGLPVRGADCLLAGEARMNWRLLEFFPVLRASGADISRSAQGRFAGEVRLWFPEALHPAQTADPNFVVLYDSQGRVRSLRFPRWGNPDGQGWRWIDFGALIEEYSLVNGQLTASRIRAGWFFDGVRFAPGGEFFRATVTGRQLR